MANEEKVTAPIERTEIPLPSILDAMDGIGIDVPALKDKLGVKTEATGSAEKPVEPTTVKEPEKKPDGTTTPTAEPGGATTVPEDFKWEVGQPVLLDDKAPPDGEYPISDTQMAVVKDGKIEKINPIEAKPDGSTTIKDVEIDNPFVSTAVEPTVVEIKEFKDAAKMIKDELGIEVKTMTDLNLVVNQHKTLQENLDKASVDVRKLSEWNQTLSNLPEELYGAMQAWLQGEDYLAVMRDEAREKPDFTKDFSANKKETVLNYYYPNKFSTEDYSDDEKEAAIEIAEDSARKLFERDKKSYVSHRDQVAAKAEQRTTALQQSIETTVNTLKKDVPYLKDSHKEKVAGIINLGPGGVMSLFLNDDGTFRPETGKLVALAVYGEDAINYHKNKAAKDAETKTTVGILDRGTGDKGKRLSPGKTPETKEELVKKELGNIVPDMGGRTIFSKRYTGEKK